MSNPLFPYVLTPEYVKVADAATLRPLGHDLSLGLVTEGESLVGGVSTEQLLAEGLTVDAAYDAAGRNLHALLRDGVVGTQAFQRGPGDLPFALFGGHWAAAACIAYPGLHQAMARALGAESLLVSVPHRGAMLVFPDRDAAGRTELQQFVRDHESDGDQPLTFGLFALDGDGLRPVD